MVMAKKTQLACNAFNDNSIDLKFVTHHTKMINSIGPIKPQMAPLLSDIQHLWIINHLLKMI